MTTELPLLENAVFYSMERPLIKGERYEKYFYKNASDMKITLYKKRKNKEFPGEFDYFDTGFQLYKNKYNMYVETDDISKKLSFKKKYNVPVHSLTISNTDTLYEIKSLPKELLVFMLYGGMDFINFKVNIIPKNIISMRFLASAFPFNGADLSKLKKLKYFFVMSKHLVVLPKFPKSIEYVYIRGSNLSFHPSVAFKHFKLKDYPNLKGIVLKDTGLSKKDIPRDILVAKKSKKIKVYIEED
jgi:hypothetical protein